jgi:hypothetical protein
VTLASSRKACKDRQLLYLGSHYLTLLADKLTLVVRLLGDACEDRLFLMASHYVGEVPFF